MKEDLYTNMVASSLRMARALKEEMRQSLEDLERGPIPKEHLRHLFGLILEHAESSERVWETLSGAEVVLVDRAPQN